MWMYGRDHTGMFDDFSLDISWLSWRFSQEVSYGFLQFHRLDHGGSHEMSWLHEGLFKPRIWVMRFHHFFLAHGEFFVSWGSHPSKWPFKIMLEIGSFYEIHWEFLQLFHGFYGRCHAMPCHGSGCDTVFHQAQGNPKYVKVDLENTSWTQSLYMYINIYIYIIIYI